MKPHITNLTHKKFCLLVEDLIQKMEEIPKEEKIEASKKIDDLIDQKQALEVIYSDYQLKLKELRSLLEEYERTKQTSRIHLRKMQLWLKFGYNKSVRQFR